LIAWEIDHIFQAISIWLVSR